MRSLYPPSPANKHADTQDLVSELVQDNVRIDEHSQSYQVFRICAALMEHAEEFLVRMDPRPWAADTRQTGTVQPAVDRVEPKRLDEIIMGPPASVQPRHLRTYGYEKTAVTSPTPTAADSIDRAIEDSDGLVVQAGNKIYRVVNGKQATEIDTSVLPAGAVDRPVLASVPDADWSLMIGEPPSTEEVAAEIEGLDIIVRGAGRFEVRLNWTGAVVIGDGSDLKSTELESATLKDDGSVVIEYTISETEIGDRAQNPLYLYDENGDRYSYTTSDTTISVGSLLESNSGPAAPPGKYLLFYRASKIYNRHTTNKSSTEIPMTAFDMGPVVEEFYDMPTTDDVEVLQETDRLGQVPVEGESVLVDGAGYAGGVYVGHPINSVAGSAYHVAVASENTVSVVEPAAHKVTWTTKPDLDGTIKGVTWTKNHQLAIVVAETTGQLDLYALDDVRTGRDQGFMPYYK